jgi:Zn-dependent alcohol dehydrogenase
MYDHPTEGRMVCVTDSYALRPGPLAHPPAILGHSAAGVVEAPPQAGN